MATISSAGIGSGLDVIGLVNSLVEAERAPTVNRYNKQELTLQAELSAYGTLKGALSSFQDTLSSLSDIDTFQSYSVSSTSPSTISATGSSLDAEGSYSIEVSNLASTQTLASGGFTNTTDAVGTGTLSFQFGTTSGSTFTADPDKTIKTVDISATDNSLQGIRDAVNAADIGVTATIVNDGSSYRLLFSTTNTGADNSLKITVANDSVGDNLDNSGLSQLAYDPAGSAGNGKNLTEKVTAEDAIFTVNGLDITHSSNTVTGVIEGLTLTLKEETAANSPVTIKVSENSAAISKSVESFITSYNELKKTIKSLSGYDAETQTGGVLLGDSIVRSVESQIRNIISGSVDGLSGSYTSLASIGITTNSAGELSLDNVKFDAALDSDPDIVGKLFAATATPSDPLVKYSGSTEDTVAGSYDLSISQLATQGVYAGANTGLSLLVDTLNDDFSLKIDGIQSGQITLTNGTYTSEAALAAELQTRINSDSVLQGAGVTVTVDYVTDHYEITSSRYGSESTVEFTSVEGAGLGFSVGSVAAGVDVAGSLDGVAGSGSGRFLTGAGDTDGLELEIQGGVTGSRGSVDFSRGIADQLSRLLDQYLGSNNFIDARTDGINDRIDDLERRREILDSRMVSLEQRYLKQFNALDTLLGQLQSTSSYLTSALASLPGAASIKKD